jgi:hypothetical protein
MVQKIMDPSQPLKEKVYYHPRMLTKQEIELLKKSTKKNGKILKEYFKKNPL